MYINAAAFLPHIPSWQFPGHTVACAFYVEGGVRSCELGAPRAFSNRSWVDFWVSPGSYRHTHGSAARQAPLESRQLRRMLQS